MQPIGGLVLPDRFVARVRGERAQAFLHDTTTQDLAGLEAGEGALTCLLDDKGRVLAEVRALFLEDSDVLLDGEPAARTHITGWLARIAGLSGCEVIDESDAWTCTAVRGEAPADISREHAFVERDGTLQIRVEWGGAGYDVLSREPIAHGGTELDREAFEAARILAGRPRYGIDVTDDMHIAETPLLQRAVSATKGCYPGQESVARVVNLGRPRRALVVLSIDAPKAPARGAPVVLDDVETGFVTSAAQADDHAIAMAIVRAETADGAEVAVEGARATVHTIR